MGKPWEKYAQAPSAPEEGPWQKYSTPEKKDEVLNPQAALEGFGQMGTAGHLAQAQAAAGGLLPDPNKDLDEKLKGEGFQIQQPDDTYLVRRDANISRQEGYEKEAPVSYYGGQVAGAVATAPIYAAGLGAAGRAVGLPAAATGAGAGFLSKTLRAAGAGAVQGAIQNPGDTKGEIDPLQAESRLQNVKTGALVGGVAQGAASALKKGTDVLLSAPERLKDYALLKSFKSTGAMLKDYRKAAERGNIQKIGQELLDKGLVKPGATFEDIAQSSQDLRQKAGAIIGDVYEQASKKLDDPAFMSALPHEKYSMLAKSELNARNLADDLEAQFVKDLKGKPGSQKALNAVNATLDELRQNGNGTSLLNYQEFKEGLDDAIKYNYDLSKEPLTKQYLFKIRDELKNKIQDRIEALDKVLGKESLQSLKEANKQYGVWAEVSRISKDRVLRENANRFMGLSDTIAGAGGAAGGAAVGAYQSGDIEGAAKGAALGAGLGLLNKGARLYGNPLVTNAAYKGAGLLQPAANVATKLAAPIGAAASNPTALGSAASRLFNQPQYKKK